MKNTLKLDITKIKSPTRKEFAFVCFRSQEDQQRGLDTLNGYKWKGKVLKALAAKASADPLYKRRGDEEAGEPKPKRQRTAVEATCPLAEMPYEKQLEQKNEEMAALLKKYTQELRRLNPAAKPHLDKFKFNGVLPSPTLDGYRNKNLLWAKMPMARLLLVSDWVATAMDLLRWPRCSTCHICRHRLNGQL